MAARDHGLGEELRLCDEEEDEDESVPWSGNEGADLLDRGI